MNRLKLRCRDATRLLLEREERSLGPVERLALKAHLLVCTACTRFDGQVKFMRGAMARWRAYTDRE
jgi:hypothetical protein